MVDDPKDLPPAVREANFLKWKKATGDWKSEPFQREKSLPGQVHDPEALLEALKVLEAGRLAPTQTSSEES